ncbi:hypothetical protein BJ742DRAFT_683736 [Cladochytrium replicatum]|nr:hypothetical protein BJ742DRAFT_683736 [Cladochytrium replicatum]
MANRNNRFEIAQSTIASIGKGFYLGPSREPVSLRHHYASSLEGTILFPFSDPIPQSEPSAAVTTPPSIEFLHCSTLEAALLLHSSSTSVGILNFASAKNPGGGFRSGANAQEESLARSSGLGLILESTPAFYAPCTQSNVPAAQKYFYTSNVLYSPSVPFFRNDQGDYLPQCMLAGVVTCAAVNAGEVRRKQPHWADRIPVAMEERIRRVMQVFRLKEHDSVVLGAFGCGVFKNSVEQVTELFHKVLVDEGYQMGLKKVFFAVLDGNMKTRMEDRWNQLSL